MASAISAVGLEADVAARCAREPIHIPGSIQPHGCLLVIDSAGAIVQTSANIAAWLGFAPDAVLSKPLAAVWPEAAAMLTESALLRDPAAAGPTHVGDIASPMAAARLALVVHHWEGCQVLELETADDRQHVLETIYPLARGFVDRLQRAPSVTAMCDIAVAEVKRITGFGRVMAYSFDAHGHGTVMSEQVDAGHASYVGLRFPGADIPAQARALYVRNRIRVIHDANYVPVPLVPALPLGADVPLDMSHAALRSVSPVHVQYMKNMQTYASMSMSIVVGDRLWGLVSCHHDTARSVPLRVRTACELIAGVLSLQIDAREQHETIAARYRLRQDVVTMLTAMAERDGVMAGLRDAANVFQGFVRGDGAAVVSGPRCEAYGNTPARADILRLCDWLQRRGTQEVFHTSFISRDVPELPELAKACAGVLAVPISSLHAHYLLWFREERVQSVNWAGQPTKDTDPMTGALTPRHSFTSWCEMVNGQSLAWWDVEIDAVQELRNSVMGLVLRKAEERAALAADLAETNKELEAFSYSVSHDLRAPMRHIAGFAELLADLEGDKLSERGRHFLSNIGESARLAGTLVDDLLNFSQMGRAALRFADVDVGALARAIRNEMGPETEDRNIEWQIQDDLPSVHGDTAFIRLALRNLLSNAVKYSRGREHAVVVVRGRKEDGGVTIDVADNGAGFDMAYADKLFGIFQRLHRMEDFEGTGIGLASVRRVIERHNGKVWAHAEVGQGATFSFWIPDQEPA